MDLFRIYVIEVKFIVLDNASSNQLLYLSGDNMSRTCKINYQDKLESDSYFENHTPEINKDQEWLHVSGRKTKKSPNPIKTFLIKVNY